MYNLGDDFDDFYNRPSNELNLEFDPNINPNVYSTTSWGSPSQSSSTDSWWGSITGALVPLSTAAANIIRATQGLAPTAGTPTGYTRNAAGNLVPLPSQGFNFQSLLLPAALGVGAYLLIKRK